MHYIHGQIIQDATVELDGGDWANCTFINCRLVYGGGDLGWSQNRTEHCDLSLHGGASLGLLLAQSIDLAKTEQVHPYRTAADLESTMRLPGAG